ncbi:MAG: DUF5711 family protein [Lachnospirales bacterium]
MSDKNEGNKPKLVVIENNNVKTKKNVPKKTTENKKATNKNKVKPKIVSKNNEKQKTTTKNSEKNKAVPKNMERSKEVPKSNEKSKTPPKNSEKVKVTPKKAEKQKKEKKPNNQKNKRKINFKIIIGIILAVIFIAAIVFLIKSKKISFVSDSSNLYSTEFGVNSKADFCVLNRNIFYCTKDVATLLDKKGQQVWSDTLSMVSPVMINDGNYVGVGDIKNKVLNVYGETGKVYSLETDGNITAFAVNKMGASAVVCRDSKDDDYSVSVYNQEGKKMFMGSYVSKDGIPITIDISDDSSKVVVGFLNVSKIDITSNILFYSTDKAVAQKIENSDAMFAAVNCDKEMVGKVKFLDNDSCIIATDKSLINIGGGDVASYEQNWKIAFANYVTALDVIGNDYVAVAYGDKFDASEEEIEKNSIYWYNAKNGKTKGSVLMESAVSKLTSGLGNSIAELEDNTFVALKPNGDRLWSYTGLQNINNILFYKGTDTIAVVSAAKMTITEVKKGAENTEIETEEPTKAQPATEENKNTEVTTVAEVTTQAETKVQ